MPSSPLSSNTVPPARESYLRQLGVYGYDGVEPVILAALVSGDPLLLVGRHGTGKTFLLNSLSEALGLEHRHYNASLVSFDDLVGFPFPENDGAGIRFIETPATVWQAESVLVDELNRCKPEHQNRFFSLVHERRIQGMKLPRLRYRWAAMNPAGEENGYIGTEPLDPALADRFAFVVRVVDWDDLSSNEKLAVADPRGEGAISQDTGQLATFLAQCQKRFNGLLEDLPIEIPVYAVNVVTALAEGGVRLSPRRARQLARNLVAATAVSSIPQEKLFRLVLGMSLPQTATGEDIPAATIEAAHIQAWATVGLKGTDKWLFDFGRKKRLSAKARMLLTQCPDRETGSVAISEFIASENPPRRLAFALAITPLLLECDGGPVGTDGLSDLAQILSTIVHLNKDLQFRDHGRTPYYSRNGRLYEGTIPDYDKALEALGPPDAPEYRIGQQLLDAIVATTSKVPEDWKQVLHAYRKCLDTVTELRTNCLKTYGTAKE